MNTTLLLKRFDELLEQLKAVEATKHYRSGSFVDGSYVENNLLINWKLKARNLLSLACGEDSEHYRTFVKLEEGRTYSTNHETMLELKAAFEAAREDYEGGYCNSLRNLVHAEVFSIELEQASELLRAGYKTPAAVVAGVVLETTLRGLCLKHGIDPASVNKMNSDLAKAGQYNLLVQKRITALADIRNNAAHGHPDKFSDIDVRDMIAQVETFVADQL
jgi:hypothetical protein